MKYICTILSIFITMSFSVFAKSPDFSIVTDKKQIEKIILAIDAQVPELKEKVQELLKLKKELHYDGNKFIITHKVKLYSKNVEGLCMKDHYLVNYGMISYLGQEDGFSIANVCVSKDLKKISFPVLSTSGFKVMEAKEWKKSSEKEKAEFEKTKLEKEKKLAPILLDFCKQVKLNKKKELLKKEKSLIISEDLDAYLREAVPELQLEEEYYKMLKPEGTVSFELERVPNEKGNHDLEKNYYVILYTYEGFSHKTRYFVPINFNESKLLVEEGASIATKGKTIDTQNIKKYQIGKTRWYLTEIYIYFKEHPESKAKLDQKARSLLKDHFQ